MSRFNKRYTNGAELALIRGVANDLGYDIISLSSTDEFWREVSDAKCATWLRADNVGQITADIRFWEEHQ